MEEFAPPTPPTRPSRVTQGMVPKDVIRLTRDMTDTILQRIADDDGETRRYDGLSEGYHAWEKAVANTLQSAGFGNVAEYYM